MANAFQHLVKGMRIQISRRFVFGMRVDATHGDLWDI